METDLEMQQESLGVLSGLAQAARCCLEDYQKIVKTAYTFGKKGKPSETDSLKMTELMDRYFFIEERLKKLQKRSQFQLKLQDWLSLNKLFFSHKKRFSSTDELKTELAFAMYQTSAEVDAEMVSVGIEFLREYDPESVHARGTNPEFVAFIWQRAHVVLEVLMIEKERDRLTSTVIQQKFVEYLRGYLLTDSTYTVYLRIFYP